MIATARAHPDLAGRLDDLASATLENRRTLIHGDVSPKNILLGPDGPVFLDAECAVYGDPAFDLAFCLTHLLLKAVLRPKSTTLYIASYRSMADAYLDGVTWEPVDGLEARATELLPALMLARVDGKSPVEYLDREQQASVRSFARAWLVGPAGDLDSLAAAWRNQMMPKEIA